MLKIDLRIVKWYFYWWGCIHESISIWMIWLYHLDAQIQLSFFNVSWIIFSNIYFFQIQNCSNKFRMALIKFDGMFFIPYWCSSMTDLATWNFIILNWFCLGITSNPFRTLKCENLLFISQTSQIGFHWSILTHIKFSLIQQLKH